MSADIVNLRRTRKTRARADREKEAANNRLVFGRSKAEKARTKAEREQTAKTVDGHRRESERS